MATIDEKTSMIERIEKKARRLASEWRIRLGTKLAGGTNFDYWAFVSDDWYANNEGKPNPKFVERASEQLEFLRSIGLKPGHRILDYGCAIMRTAQILVPYVGPHLYVGADVGRRVVRGGIERLSQVGISRWDYQIVNVRSSDLIELEGFEFDYIFSDSALQYVSDEDFALVVSAFRRQIAPDGMVYITFPDEGWQEVLARKGHFYRSPGVVKQLCESAGFSTEFKLVSPNEYPRAPSVLLRPRVN
jgi:SAM-dependent methyltransferase